MSVDDPVVNGQGLVGRVTKVTLNASQVMLVTDQQSFVDAMIVPGTEDGSAQGIVGGSVTGDVTLDYVDKSEKVKVGQDVVTSGRNGSIFVKGILIGTGARASVCRRWSCTSPSPSSRPSTSASSTSWR